jgi:two-component system sensor histidine kinase VicK
MEYAIIAHNDQQLRWIRSTGKRYKGVNGRPNYFTGTVQDITERKADDQRKSDFIAMVSHELKTPLTSVTANIQFLLGEARKGKDRLMAETLERAHRQLGKMNTMINGFLSVSRLESGKIHIDRKRFDMKELVKGVEDEIVTSTLSHKVIFHPVLTTWVNGDRDKIGHVISNFISNSIKYSLPGTSIQVACQAVDGYSQLSVQDQGIGIAKKDIDRLFERYYRVEDHETAAIAGFGIGLYLSDEIIKRHGGEIWVTSEVGKGSIFYFKLPIVD